MLLKRNSARRLSTWHIITAVSTEDSGLFLRAVNSTNQAMAKEVKPL